MTAYSLTITLDSETYLASANGSLKVVKTAYDEAKVLDQTGIVNVELFETGGINGDQVGEKALISITSDGETADAVADRRFKVLRKTDPDVPARKPRKSKGATETPAETETVTDLSTPTGQAETEVTQY